jgi:hypothetical protein
MAEPLAYLGTGVVLPFRRDGKDDFAHATGIDLINSSLLIILGTRRAGPSSNGEVPFNQKLGTLLPHLRHRNLNNPTTEELATHYVVDSISENEPRVQPKAVGYKPRPAKNRLALRLRYDIVSRDTTGTNVVARDVEEDFEL